MNTDTQNNDAIRELLAKRVTELEARNKALVSALENISKLQRDKCANADADTLFMVLDNKVSIAEAALAANAPAPVVERAPIGSLK